MRWHIKRAKLLFALIPLISMAFFILTSNDNIYADQSFIAFDIYQQISDTAKPADGTSPSDYSAAENFAIAADVYANTDSVHSTVTGTVTALKGLYKQTVLNTRAKTGGYLFNESVSLSSIASVAEQRFFKNGALLYRNGEASGNAVKSWSDTITELAPAVYRQRYGIVPREITKYSVTSGVEGSIKSGRTVSEKDDGTYIYELILDADKAQKYSRYEMMTFAGVSTYPEFKSCRIVFTIDSDWRIRELKSYDSYSIDIMNGIACESSLTEKFEYTEGYMPERAQLFIDYVPTGNTGEVVTKKGPADYLNEAFGDYISGKKDLNLNATITAGGQKLDLAAVIGIKEKDFRFKIGNDIFAVYKDDSLYIAVGENKYRIGMSDLTPLLKKLGIDLGELSDTAELLEKLFENHTITETDTNVYINMPFELAGINLDVDMGLIKDGSSTKADTIKADILIGGITVNADIKVAESVTLPEFCADEYLHIGKTLEAVVNTLSSKSFMLDLGGNVKYGDLSENFRAVFTADTADGLSFAGALEVSGQNIEFVLKNNTVYLSVGEIALKLELSKTKELLSSIEEIFGSAGKFAETIAPLIGKDNADAATAALDKINDMINRIINGDSVDLQSVLDKMGFMLPEIKDINDALGILNGLSVTDEKISLRVSPANGEPYTLSMDVLNGYIGGIALDRLNIGDIALSFNATLTCGGKYDITVQDEEYIDLAVISKIAPTVNELLSASAYKLKIENGKLNTSLVSGDLSGELQLSLDPLKASGKLRFRSHDISFAFDGETIYIAVNDIRLRFKPEDVNDIIAELQKYIKSDSATVAEVILETVEYASIIQSALGGKTLADIMSYVTYAAPYGDRGITATVSISDFSASFNLYAENGVLSADVYNFNYGSDIFDSSIDLRLTAAENVNTAIPEANAYADLAMLKSYISPVMNTVNQRYFDLSFSGSIADVKNSVTDVSGKIKIARTDGFADIYAQILLGGNTGNHDLQVYLLDGTEYGNEGFDVNKLTAYISYNGFTAKIDYASVMRIVGALCDILDLRSPVIDELIKDVYDMDLDTSVFETMKIAGLDTLRDTLASMLGALEDSDITSGGLSGLLGLVTDGLLDDILRGVSLEFNDSELTVKIDNGIFDPIESGNIAAVTVGHNGELLTHIGIRDLIADGNRVTFDARLSCDEFDKILPPQSDNIRDFSSIDELLIAMINTAGMRQFNITGSVDLNLLGLVKPSIPFDVKVKILDDGSTAAAVKLSVPFVSAVFGVGITRSESYIYFVNDRLYFVADIWSSWAWGEGSYDRTETRSATVEEFLADPMDYLFFLIRMNKNIETPIRNAISGSGNGAPSYDLNNILKKYAYDGRNFELVLGLGALTGSSDLKDLNIKLNTTEGFISGLSLDTQFTDMNITLSLKNTILKNLERNEEGKLGAGNIGNAEFGRIDNDGSLSCGLEYLEDSLAALFPVEAAETFGEKAADKAQLARDAAAKAINADVTVDESAAALIEAQTAYDAAIAKLVAIPEGSFGYTRAKAQAEHARNVLERAEENAAQANPMRIKAAGESCDAAQSAYYYARKAAEFAEKASMQQTVRGYSAAGKAAQAAIQAVNSATQAAEKAIYVADRSGDDGKNISDAATSLRDEIISGQSSLASAAAKAANSATTATIAETENAADLTLAQTKSGELLKAVASASDTIAAITAMKSASQAAMDAAVMACDDALTTTANSNAELTVSTALTAAVNTANALCDIINGIIETGNTLSGQASTPEEITSAIEYARAAINAADAVVAVMSHINDNGLSDRLAASAEIARSASRQIGNTLMDIAVFETNNYAAQVSTASTDIAGIRSATSALDTASRYLDSAVSIAKYSSNGPDAVTRAYTVAAKAANELLHKANDAVFQAASQCAIDISSACAKANIVYGSNDHAAVIDSSNAIKNSVASVPQTTSVISSAVQSAYNVYNKTLTLLDETQREQVKDAIARTVNGENGMKKAVELLNDSRTAASASAQKLVNDAQDKLGYVWNKPMLRKEARDAAENAVKAVDSVTSDIASAEECFTDIIAFYNRISKL